MIRLISHGLAGAALATGLCAATLTFAQDGNAPRSVFDRVFGGNPDAARTTGQDSAQGSPAELVLRIDRLEAQIRELTGTIEQLQYRNRQLETQIRAMGAVPSALPGVVQGPVPAAQGSVAAAQVPVQSQAAQPIQPMRPAPPMQPAAQAASVARPPGVIPSRRSDVFDPTQNPSAPGAPHVLGSLPAETTTIMTPETPVGAPGGRLAGAPLDLSTLATGERGGSLEPNPSLANGPLPPPPSRNPSATGVVASVAPPSDSPQDTYDLAYGYLLRKDYALAEDAFQTFLKKYPSDRRAPDAQFWLGESLFQRQQYDTAAAAFLDLSTKYKSHGKAPEALLRLAQSLAAMKQKEMACATLAEVSRKYPRAPGSVKLSVDREQKRVHC